MNLTESIELFSFPFMQRAIAGGILLGILGGILGGFVVLRRLSVFGHALGHAAFLGVVLAALLQLPPTASLMGFLIVVGLGVIYLIEQTNLSGDIVLSIVVAGALALATILFNFLQGYRGNLLSVLFGDILAISNTDLILLGVLLAVTVGGLILTLPQQILLTFNPELAKIKGISVLGNRYGFIIIL
ncbi:MAG: metal ABC transporter permease, partial [Okeania sp. SIO2H7]|nr:metal ABC transporter permease [Okeania sp. SIO2H7]